MALLLGILLIVVAAALVSDWSPILDMAGGPYVFLSFAIGFTRRYRASSCLVGRASRMAGVAAILTIVRLWFLGVPLLFFVLIAFITFPSLLLSLALGQILRALTDAAGETPTWLLIAQISLATLAI
jgi:hypothetical protein